MTKNAGVIGWPITHSRSPLIHGSWIEEHGIDGSYRAIAVNPLEADDWLSKFTDHGLVGANVTIPHKEAALRACDYIEPHAERLGAVNTLWLEGTHLHGTSTDGAGFLAHLQATVPNWKEGSRSASAVILGAGGAARAIIDQLLVEGLDRITILNRTESKAAALAVHFKRCFPAAAIDHGALERFTYAAPQAGLIVNTTSMGMQGQPPLAVPLRAAKAGTVVYDIVYAPLETDLLKHAAQYEMIPVDGLGMLLHQAVPGFERWFGVKPDVTDRLRRRVIADLRTSSADDDKPGASR